MKRKRNVIKRNSGFLACCVLVAGASFGTANLVMEKGMVSLVMPSEEQTPEKTRETAPPEKSEKRVYETDAFTVTASGNIIKGVETEAPEKKETEKQTETDANGNPIGNGTQMNENGTDSVGNGAGSSGSGSDQDGSGNSGGNGSYNDTAGTDPGDSSWDNAGENAGNSSWDDYSGPSIVITDPGNGYYYKADIIKQYFIDSFKTTLRGTQYSFPKDSTSAITIKVVDKKNKKICYGCDFAIIYYGDYDEADGYYYLRNNKKQGSYQFAFRALNSNIEETVEDILKYDGWNYVRDEYLKLKNINEGNRKHSYSLYIEAVNNVYNQMFLQ